MREINVLFWDFNVGSQNMRKETLFYAIPCGKMSAQLNIKEAITGQFRTPYDPTFLYP